MFSPHARRLVALAVLVVALEAVCRAHLVRPTDLVPPTIMLRSMAAALTEPVTLYNVWQTLMLGRGVGCDRCRCGGRSGNCAACAAATAPGL